MDNEELIDKLQDIEDSARHCKLALENGCDLNGDEISFLQSIGVEL